MKSFTIAALAAAFLLTTQSIAGAQVSFGIRIGPPPPAFVIHAVPGQPVPAYAGINGTGIRSEITTGGTTATGLGRHI